MKSRHAIAASTSTSPLAAASRAPCTASPGRNSVFDGMHAQYEHSPPTSSRSTSATRSPPSASAPAQCSPGEPPPSTMTSYSLLMATSVADGWRVSVAPGHAPRARGIPGQPPGPSRTHRRLGGRGFPVRATEGIVQAHARADLELGEHLPQVPLDCAGAEEQPGADLGIGKTVAREAGDLLLLRRELVARLDRALARPRARRHELAAGALGERLHADRVEHLVGGAQLRARIRTPALPAQPLAVE